MIKQNKRNKPGNYIISFDTFALIPIIKDGIISTRVIERNGDLIVPRKNLQIIKHSCIHYGGSLQNSTKSSILAIGKYHKIPIMLAHDAGVPCIFLPTMSPTSEHTVWFLHSAIVNIIPDEMGCLIVLENNQSFKVNISAISMKSQLSNATLLERSFLLKQRALNRVSTFENDNSANKSRLNYQLS